MKRFLAALLLVAAPVAAGGFDRPDWQTKDCRSTRSQVMARQCAAITWDAKGCRPVTATCKDVYEGVEISTDSPGQALHVDHVFPASIAWKRGDWRRPDGSRCTSPRRTRTDPGCPAFEMFYNDQRNLLVVRARTNMRKNDKMPQAWCPATRGGRRVAAARFQDVAVTYRLRILPAELVGLEAWKAGSCAPGATLLN